MRLSSDRSHKARALEEGGVGTRALSAASSPGRRLRPLQLPASRVPPAHRGSALEDPPSSSGPENPVLTGGPAPAPARASGALLVAGRRRWSETPRSAACRPASRSPASPPAPPPRAVVGQRLAGGPRAGRPPHPRCSPPAS